MYNRVRGLMSYRSFYVWRARCRYFARYLDGWRLVTLLCFFGVLALLWYHWRVANLPPPRVHPEAAALRVESITKEAIHRIVLVRHGGETPGQEFTTPEAVRASTLRTMQVRAVLDSEMAWRLKARMLADIGDYIHATGGCVPYDCRRVRDRLEFVRRAGVENAEINAGLAPLLDIPLDRMPCLDVGERRRVKSGWSDTFNDIYYQAWLLRDLQTMHAQMMLEYPKRAPAPWLPRLFSDPIPDPRIIW